MCSPSPRTPLQPHCEVMTDWLSTYVTDEGKATRKVVFLSRESCASIIRLLKPLYEGASSGADASGGSCQQRGAGGGATTPGSTFSDTWARRTCQVVEGTDGEVLCRRMKRKGSVVLLPVVPLEDLLMVFESEHDRLGHPGYEVLYDQVNKLHCC